MEIFGEWEILNFEKKKKKKKKTFPETVVIGFAYEIVFFINSGQNHSFMLWFLM